MNPVQPRHIPKAREQADRKKTAVINGRKRRRNKKSGLLGCVLRRTALVLVTAVAMVLLALVMMLNMIFNGPSPSARNVLTMSLIEASATKWIPALFIGEDTVARIRADVEVPLTDEVTDTSAVIIKPDGLSGNVDEWADYPDGIRIEQVTGTTYNAYVMIVRDPSAVSMGISTREGFRMSVPGKRLTAVMEEPSVLAAVNGGAFNDDSTSGSHVGSLPLGLVYSEGECVWTSGAPTETKGFAGFNEENVLIVHTENITKAQAEELKIRDGCCFGPVLIMNGEVNMEAYNKVSGLNPRTAIGQREDGAVIFVCIDGRQISSMGGDYADLINIMQEYGAVNACNMDGGSSTVMMYRDTWGLYGEPGQVQMINSYSLLQKEPRRMPDFWVVRQQPAA